MKTPEKNPSHMEDQNRNQKNQVNQNQDRSFTSQTNKDQDHGKRQDPSKTPTAPGKKDWQSPDHTSPERERTNPRAEINDADEDVDLSKDPSGETRNKNIGGSSINKSSADLNKTTKPNAGADMNKMSKGQNQQNYNAGSTPKKDNNRGL